MDNSRDKVDKSKVVLLITNILTPYRIPLFNELDSQLRKRGMKLNVVFASYSYPLRKWNVDLSRCEFDFSILNSRKITLSDEKNIYVYNGLNRMVRKLNPIVIITSGFSFATLRIWIRSWFIPTPYIIWSGNISHRKKSDSFLRRFQRKILASKATGFIAYGKLAREYLISLGVDPEKIEIGINTVDTRSFLKKTEDIKKKLSNRENKVLLCVGYLVKRKRVDLLFPLMKMLKRKHENFVLKLVGDGPERSALMKLARDLGIIDCVSFEGYKQANELPRYFAYADCLLFPTGFDIWGLVLVEAMAVGIPCLASVNAGASHDLIQDGVNGYIVDFKKTEEAAEKISGILDNLGLLKSIGERAKNFIEKNCTLEKSVSGFVNAIMKSLAEIK